MFSSSPASSCVFMSWLPNSLPNPTKTQLFLKLELPLALSSHPPPLEAISFSWPHQICCWPACIRPNAALGTAFPHLLLLLSDPLYPPAHSCCCLLHPMSAFGSARLRPCSARGLLSCPNASCSFLLILSRNCTHLVYWCTHQRCLRAQSFWDSRIL